MVINFGRQPKHAKLWWLIGGIIFLKSLLLAFIMFPYQYPQNLQILEYAFIYIPFILFIMSFAFLFNGRWGYWYLFLVDFFVSALLLADALYFQAYGNPITFFIVQQYSCLEDLGGSILSMLRLIHVLFVVDLPFLVLYLGFKQIKDERNVKIFAVMALLMFIPCLFQMRIFVVKCLPTYALIMTSPIGYHLYDFLSVIQDQNYSLTSNEEQTIDNWLKNNQAVAGDYNSDMQGIFKGKNLIVIQFESLETFVIDERIGDQEVTPTLNRLLANSLYFPNVLTQVADGGSGDAEFIFSTSLYPLSRGAVFYRFPGNTYSTLPDLLKKQGYHTLAIHGDDPNFWNRAAVFPNLGFMHFVGEDDFAHDDIIGMGLSDKSMYHQSLSILNELDEPYFAYFITLTSHVPFTVPKNERKLVFPDAVDNGLAAYFQGINYADRALGGFLAELADHQMLQDAVIVIFGDHDGYHRYFEKTGALEDKRVPLIIYQSGINPQSFDEYGGQIDIFPTVADVMGIPAAKYTNKIMGKNLITTTRGYAVLGNGEYVGDIENQEHNLRGPLVADLIIKSNYFGENN